MAHGACARMYVNCGPCRITTHGADTRDNLKFSLAYIIANLHVPAAARNQIIARSFLPLKIHHGQ